MADDRLWMFNPGGADIPCCGEGEEECGQLCVVMTRGNPGSQVAGDGITLDGGTLGTCTTDSDGRCCFDVPGSGRYAFVASKSGYISNTFSVVVDPGDCDGSGAAIEKPGGNLDPVTVPSGCKDIWITQCGACDRPGVAVTVTASSLPGWTFVGVTQHDGRTRVCRPPGSTSTGTVTLSIPGDGGPQADTTITLPWADFWGGGSVFQADHIHGWFCFPGQTNHCMESFPDQVTATWSAAWGEDEGGVVRTVPLLPDAEVAAEYELWYPVTGAWKRFEMELSWEHGVVCGAKGAGDGRIFTAASPDDPPYSSQQLLLDPDYGTVQCPINVRLYLTIGGVPFPDFYVIVTE